jgi:hypothetical protein
MTKTELKKTKWAKEFKKECPDQYEEALELALNPDLRVFIQKSDASGIVLWAVSTGELNPEFWLDAKKTKKEALALCKEMGWKVNRNA